MRVFPIRTTIGVAALLPFACAHGAADISARPDEPAAVHEIASASSPGGAVGTGLYHVGVKLRLGEVRRYAGTVELRLRTEIDGAQAQSQTATLLYDYIIEVAAVEHDGLVQL